MCCRLLGHQSNYHPGTESEGLLKMLHCVRLSSSLNLCGYRTSTDRVINPGPELDNLEAATGWHAYQVFRGTNFLANPEL